MGNLWSCDPDYSKLPLLDPDYSKLPLLDLDTNNVSSISELLTDNPYGNLKVYDHIYCIMKPSPIWIEERKDGGYNIHIVKKLVDIVYEDDVKQPPSGSAIPVFRRK